MVAIGEARSVRPAHVRRIVTDKAPVLVSASPKFQEFQRPVHTDVILDANFGSLRLAHQCIPIKNDSAAEDVVQSGDRDSATVPARSKRSAPAPVPLARSIRRQFRR